MYASEDAARLRGASERLRRALDKVASAEDALAAARRELHAAQRAEYGWTDGLAGRRIVADALVSLAPLGWTFLDAVHWPGRPGVVIDHVGVGPGGVVVMFSRQWTGAVEVRGGVLRQNGVPRLRETAAVSAAAGAVSALLDPEFRTAVSAFVCAVQHDVRPDTVPPGVNVVGVRDVGDAVRALTVRLTPDEVERVLASLRAALVGPDAPDQLTTRALTVYGDGRDDGFYEAPGDVPPTTVLPTVLPTSLPTVLPTSLPGDAGSPVAAVPGQGGRPADLFDGRDDLDDRDDRDDVDHLDHLDDLDFEPQHWGGASRGRHRAPSVLWSRTAHAAERGRELLAVPLAVAAALGCVVAALVAWLGVWLR